MFGAGLCLELFWLYLRFLAKHEICKGSGKDESNVPNKDKPSFVLSEWMDAWLSASKI